MATPTSLPATFVAGNVLTAAQMNDLRGAFRVLQVVSTIKDDTFSTTSTSPTDVTGLSVAITPTSATSKVLVLAQVASAATGGHVLKLLRGATEIAAGAGGTKNGFYAQGGGDAGNGALSGSVNFLDSPATTSATTYKIQIECASGTSYVNRRTADTYFNPTSQITVMEVSA